MEKLTKENFWNELHTKYPAEMDIFCKWIDEYKKRVSWNMLFNSDSDYQNAQGKNAPAPKYHDLPIAMQIGIFIQFVAESDNRFGLEIPHIETQVDFQAIPDLIKDFFFSENDEAVTTGRLDGEEELVPEDKGEEDDEPDGEEHF